MLEFNINLIGFYFIIYLVKNKLKNNFAFIRRFLKQVIYYTGHSDIKFII